MIWFLSFQSQWLCFPFYSICFSHLTCNTSHTSSMVFLTSGFSVSPQAKMRSAPRVLTNSSSSLRPSVSALMAWKEGQRNSTLSHLRTQKYTAQTLLLPQSQLLMVLHLFSPLIQIIQITSCLLLIKKCNFSTACVLFLMNKENKPLSHQFLLFPLPSS